MAKIWKIVGIVSAAAFIFGALCFLVGYITGGSIERLQDLFNTTYDLDSIRTAIENAVHKVLSIQVLK